MSKKVDAYVKQTYGYFYDDGLVELIMGFFFVLVGGIFVATQMGNKNPLINLLLSIGLVVLILGGSFSINHVVRSLKQRVTYPRTGYVAYKNEVDKRSNKVIWGAVIFLITISLFLPDAFSQVQFMIGGVLAAMLVFLGYRTNVWRFYILALAVFLIGIFTTALFIDEVLGTGLTFLGTGCLLLISGSVTLVRYLHQHPVIEDGVA